MMTLLASVLGFFTAIVPDILKIFRDSSDKKHEITLLTLQMEWQKTAESARLQEMGIAADTVESEVLYRTWYSRVKWVDALNGTVRPVITYAFFGLYAAVKIVHYSPDMPWLLWNAEDQAIFAGIISFYFGQRAMVKARGI